ncbi:odorant binding protein, partial [Diachasma alloeum]
MHPPETKVGSCS